MPAFHASDPKPAPLSTRLSQLTTLKPDEVQALQLAELKGYRFPAKSELVSEGEPVRDRRALVSGWACRQRVLPDGRRQILGLLFPGDLIGVCQHSAPVASTTVLAISDLVTCPVPRAEAGSSLAEAYARSAALEEGHLMAHITRLGRLNAIERLADWLLEIRTRLALVGFAVADRIPLPMTQEMLADTLGLTAVHVNRTLQALRRDGLVGPYGGKMISLLDPNGLARLAGYKEVRISLDR